MMKNIPAHILSGISINYLEGSQVPDTVTAE